MIVEERNQSIVDDGEAEVSISEIRPIISKNDSKMEIEREELAHLEPKSKELYEIDLYYDAQMSLQVTKDDQKIVVEDFVTPNIEKYHEKRPTKYMWVTSCLDKQRETLIRRRIKLLLVDHFYTQGWEGSA